MNWLSERPDNLVLPLDFASAIGGPLKNAWQTLANAEECSWFLSNQLLIDLKAQTVQAEIRTTEALKVLEEWPIEKFCAREDDVFMATRWLKTIANLERKVSVAGADSFSIPDLADWSQALFSSLDPVVTKAGIKDYLAQFPEAGKFPWEGLRFFPGALRKRDLAAASLAAIDWARFQARMSPHTEMKEESTLAVGETIINPTLQILRPAESGRVSGNASGESIHLVWRWDDQLHETQIGWREGLLIDEISENPRAQLNGILEHVKQESLGMTGLLGQDHQTFEEVFLRLSLAHVFLTR